MQISRGLIRAAALSLFLVPLVSVGLCLAADTDEPEEVSIIAMIARPRDFDGKLVRTIGFVSCQFEGTALFVSREDWLHAISKNGVSLETPEERCNRSGVDLNYGLVEGRFSASNLGHKSALSGALAVTRLELWSREAKPRNKK
jgi:hypothetical protein